jgi:regulator of protease activity HflC (stomatin/prohibitin superfamily)
MTARTYCTWAVLAYLAAIMIVIALIAAPLALVARAFYSVAESQQKQVIRKRTRSRVLQSFCQS